MERKVKYTSIAVSLFLIVVTAFFAFTLTGSAVYDNYARPGSTSNKTLYGADVLKMGLSLDIDEREARYLELYADYALTYGSSIPSSYITAEYDEGEKRLAVYAFEYTYISEGGAEVSWIPERAFLRGVGKPLIYDDERGAYTAIFTEVYEGDDNTVKVDFSSSFDIPANAVNAMLNMAYYDAIAYKEVILQKEAEYERLRGEYLQKSADYQEYLAAMSEYKIALALYKNYLSEKRIYDEAIEEYNAYIESLAEYELKAKEYSAYLTALEKYAVDYDAYIYYINNKDRVAAQTEAYNEYISKIEKVRAQLKILDSIKTPVTSLGRTLYSDIMGGTVTDVLENKDAIANNVVGASGAVIDAAGVATENLRSLIKGYFECQTENEKYSYYVLNYEGFRDNFADLLRCLDNLYLVKKVRAALIMEEKQEKFIILMAELYYVVNALSDTPVYNYDKTLYFDSSYYIGKGYNDAKKPSSVITDEKYMPDTNSAVPLSDGYPSEVKKPEALTPVSEPKKPTPVAKPIEPDKVAEPTVPQHVNEPQLPHEVASLGEPPQPYEAPEGVLDIIELYEDGLLSYRAPVAEDLPLKITVQPTKKFIGATSASIIFHDTDGSMLHAVTVESGTYAEYVGSLPIRQEDLSATYEFAGWADENGEIVDVSCVNSDLRLYPYFTPIYKKYPVHWSIDGVTYTEVVMYGEMPTCPKEPEKPEDNSSFYTFAGWDKQLSEVIGEVTYTAIFRTESILPFENGHGAEIEYYDGLCVADCRSSFDRKFQIDGVISRISGTHSLTLKTAHADISFSYAETTELIKLGVACIEVFNVKKGALGYSYEFKLYDASGDEVDAKIKASFTTLCSISDLAHLQFYYIENGERRYVRNTLSDGYVTFSAVAGRTYYALLEYNVNLLPSGPVGVKIKNATVRPADTVSLEISVPNGVMLQDVYYVTEDGIRHSVSQNSFVMPYESIMIGVDYTYCKYTVVFMSDGKVISRAVYEYGDTVAPPVNPKKANDAKYSYEFIGWDREVLPVAEDVTFTALFKATLLPVKSQDGLQMTDSVKKLLVLGASATGCFALIVLPGIALWIVLRVKRCRIYASEKSSRNRHKKFKT